jgi:hypothetical protein
MEYIFFSAHSEEEKKNYRIRLIDNSENLIYKQSKNTNIWK